MAFWALRGVSPSQQTHGKGLSTMEKLGVCHPEISQWPQSAPLTTSHQEKGPHHVLPRDTYSGVAGHR